jgi:isopentenyl diphosphate isomerase/L-lactate dehydrogenase-like FMN-dependent dehydrogenase
MAKVDWNGDGKADFSINLPQIITIVSIIVSMAGSYYTLKNKIEVLETRIIEAKRLPKPEISKKDIDGLKIEYDLKIEKVAVQAKENMENLHDFEKEVRNHYRRNK